MDARARERMKLPPGPDFLPEVIARHGFDPESIDIVLNSHLHWDHCGGNTHLRGGHARVSFPRARYYTSRGEWEHAHMRHSRDSISYIDSNYDPLIESGHMTLVEGDFAPVPGVWMRTAAGHNRDMMIVTAASGGETFCFFSDLIPTATHVQPTWVASFDLFPLESIDNKNRWLGEAAAGSWICAFGHDPTCAFARIVPHSKTRFAAVPAIP
jgi:glyoxylase-like metal-dependent hydrolase (beta-lactamase superfamily II)